MPSVLHEGIIGLVRAQPSAAAGLLRVVANARLPAGAQALINDSALNEVVPIEHRADAVVLLKRKKSLLSIVVEVQLQRDGDKRFAWPVYMASSRERHRCPCVVLVIVPNAAIARWASRPILLGGDQVWAPTVVNVASVAPVTDLKTARRSLLLALLSLIAHAHGRLEVAVRILHA